MRRKKKEKEKEEVDKVDKVEEEILMLAAHCSALEEDLKGRGHSFTDSWLARLAKKFRKWLQQRLIWVNP